MGRKFLAGLSAGNRGFMAFRTHGKGGFIELHKTL